MIVVELLKNPVGLLFTVIVLGILIGNIPFGKMKLGGSGVLLAGILFGHFGYSLPKEIQTIGVVFFVYSVGLRAGPYFLASLKNSKGAFVILAFVITISAALTAIALKYLFGISAQMIVGIYAGAMTSTPALAAAIEALGDSTASIGYGVAYPFGILGVILSVQILPKIFRVSMKKEAEDFKATFTKDPIVQRVFRICNANVTKMDISELAEKIPEFSRIARVKRGEYVFTPSSDVKLYLDDLVLVVGREKELGALTVIFGEAPSEDVPYSDLAVSRWTALSSKKLAGRSIASLEIGQLFGVIITRVRRDNIEILPTANFVLEAGDELRISGVPSDIERFEQIIKKDSGSLNETNFFSFSLGLALGVLLGLIRIPLGRGLELNLGMAGGPLMIGILFGHVGRFGMITGRMPKAATLLTGELGLYFFLAVAGCHAGLSFFHVLAQEGFSIIFYGMAITMVPILVAVAVGRLILKQNFLILLGTICGGMTSTPALGVLTSQTESEIPSLGYTGIYPIAVLLTTLAAQIIILF